MSDHPRKNAHPALRPAFVGVDDLADPPRVGQEGVRAPVAGQADLPAVARHRARLLGILFTLR